MTERDLTGKRVLVLGGETAVGRTLTVGLAKEGASVAIASLTPSREVDFAVNSALNELWATGREGVALVIDASDAEALARAVVQAEREIGRVDVACAVGASPAALDAVRGALGDRPVVEVAEDASEEEAITTVAESLQT